MDTMAAYMMGMANRGGEQKVFDWDKAARIIKEQGIKEAFAGLSEDFGNTGGMILKDGKPIIDDYTYLASTWAMPVLVNLDNGSTEIPCYIMQSQTEWDAKTKWPLSALNILMCDLQDSNVQEEPQTDEPDYKKYISIEWLKKYASLCCTFDMNKTAIHFVDTWMKMHEMCCCERKDEN